MPALVRTRELFERNPGAAILLAGSAAQFLFPERSRARSGPALVVETSGIHGVILFDLGSSGAALPFEWRAAPADDDYLPSGLLDVAERVRVRVSALDAAKKRAPPRLSLHRSRVVEHVDFRDFGTAFESAFGILMATYIYESLMRSSEVGFPIDPSRAALSARELVDESATSSEFRLGGVTGIPNKLAALRALWPEAMLFSATAGDGAEGLEAPPTTRARASLAFGRYFRAALPDLSQPDLVRRSPAELGDWLDRAREQLGEVFDGDRIFGTYAFHRHREAPDDPWCTPRVEYVPGEARELRSERSGTIVALLDPRRAEHSLPPLFWFLYHLAMPRRVVVAFDSARPGVPGQVREIVADRSEDVASFVRDHLFGGRETTSVAQLRHIPELAAAIDVAGRAAYPETLDALRRAAFGDRPNSRVAPSDSSVPTEAHDMLVVDGIGGQKAHGFLVQRLAAESTVPAFVAMSPLGHVKYDPHSPLILVRVDAGTWKSRAVGDGTSMP